MITVDMVMWGFRLAHKMLEKIAVSRASTIAQEEGRIAFIEARIAEHNTEMTRATAGAEKMKELLV